MVEETKDTGKRPSSGAAVEDKTFQEVLKGLVGQTVTIVNPESYESAPVGYKLTTGFYKGKVTALGNDYLVVVTEFERKKGTKEPVKQFVPLNNIKRVSILKSERILHL